MGEKLHYARMREITHEEYLRYIQDHDRVVIEDVEIALRKKWELRQFSPPKDYKL